MLERTTRSDLESGREDERLGGKRKSIPRRVAPMAKK